MAARQIGHREHLRLQLPRQEPGDVSPVSVATDSETVTTASLRKLTRVPIRRTILKRHFDLRDARFRRGGALAVSGIYFPVQGFELFARIISAS